jgi:4-aminobutyrate aminotransferase/(S)-3-amino-2-methylpropionate transaminase
LAGIRKECDRTGTVMIADEIWTGLGRSGHVVSCPSADIVLLGKGLGGGFPISACIGRSGVMSGWGAHGGSTIHTATHFGWPIACRTALCVLDALATRHLPERAQAVGEVWRALLPDASGEGLMIGVKYESARTALATARALLERGWIVLTGGVDGDTITLTPPLDIDERLLIAFAEAHEAVSGK